MSSPASPRHALSLVCIVIVLITTPAASQTCLELIGGSSQRAAFTSAVADGRHLFVADADHRLRVFDISIPSVPAEVGSLRTSGHPIDLSLVGSQLVLTENDFATYLVDVTDPTAPAEQSRHVTPPGVQAVVLDGDHAYLANFSSGLTILDVSNPRSLQRRGTLDTPGFSYGVAVHREHVILGDLTGGLRIVDVSRPNRPKEVASLPDLRRASDLVTYKDVAFVADGSNGIAVVDLANPSEPRLLGAIQTSATAQQRQVLAISDDTLLVGDDHLWMFDLSDAHFPRLIDSFELPVESDTTDIATAGDHVFVTGSASGFLVFDRAACHSVAQSASAPETSTGVVATGTTGYGAVDTASPAAQR